MVLDDTTHIAKDKALRLITNQSVPNLGGRLKVWVFVFLQVKTQTLKMTIVGGLRIIDSNVQTGTTWWNWTTNYLPSFFLVENSLFYGAL